LWSLAVLLVGLSWGTARRAVAGEHPADFRVVVHKGNPMSSASRELLTDVFLKRVSQWSGGETIHPVDQRPNASVRKSFSENVLKRSVAAVRSYWQQRIFSGRDVPPPELDSDEAVVSYVGSHPGAVGYVSVGAKLGEARELTID
jgi:ABC-type phosphate transport system substrate-binding protein